MVTTLYGVAMTPIIKVNTLRMLSDHQLGVLMMVQILTCILQVEHILPLIYLLQIQNLSTVLESFTPCPTNSVPRWNFNKADWDRFVGLCKEKITADTFQHDTDPIESFSNLLINIASDSISKTLTVTRIKKPWFTQICKHSVKQCKKAEKYFRLHPSPANLNLYKIKQEQHKLNFTSDTGEDYNELFSLDKLLTSLNKAKDTAVGLDNIHYQLLKHLPVSCLLVLRDIFNNIWLIGNFPPSRHGAIVVPIPKPGKDHTDPINYRPISLTSYVCKTLERIVNNRLTWCLEINNLLTNIQCGF